MDIIEFNEEKLNLIYTTEFCSVYRKSVDLSDKIFKRFIDFILDEEQMKELIFLNDEYNIPPADYFTRKNKDIITLDIANDRNTKQYIGAYFGYLFKFIYKDYYKEESVSIKFKPCNRYVLSSASYFIRREK